jgi:hypothetical protein
MEGFPAVARRAVNNMGHSSFKSFLELLGRITGAVCGGEIEAAFVTASRAHRHGRHSAF